MSDQHSALQAIIHAATAEQPSPAEGEGDVLGELAQCHMRYPGRLHALLGSALMARQALGLERYGRPLQRGNGRDYLADALQEALDLYGYTTAAKGVDQRLYAARDKVQELCLALVGLLAARARSGGDDRDGNRWLPDGGELRVLVGASHVRRAVRTLGRVEGEPLGVVHPASAGQEVAKCRAAAEQSYIGRVYWTLSPLTLNHLRPEEAVIVTGSPSVPVCRQMSEIPNIDRLLTGFTLGELWLAHADDEDALFRGVEA